MIKYLLCLKRAGRSWIDPLPMDVGPLYYIYPDDMGTVKGVGFTGLGRKLANRATGLFSRRGDETKCFRPEKIY